MGEGVGCRNERGVSVEKKRKIIEPMFSIKEPNFQDRGFSSKSGNWKRVAVIGDGHEVPGKKDVGLPKGGVV